MQVFISYSHADKPFVKKLATDLRERGISVWFDEWEMSPGDSISQRIQEGIKESTIFLIVLSSKSINSGWCQKELSAAWNLEIKRKSKFVVPVLYEECELSLFLIDKLYADFRQDYSAGLVELLKALPVITYREMEITCPHCGNVEAQTVRVPTLGPIENKAIDCSYCNQRYFLHIRKGGSGYFTTISDSSDYAVHPVQGLDLIDAARWSLKKIGAWIPPKQLGGILRLMKETEERLRKSSGEITSSQLLTAMLNSDDVALYAITRQRVREFITLLRHSRYFIYKPIDSTRPESHIPYVHTPYVNTYDEQRVIECYLKGCFQKLRRAKAINTLKEAIVASEFLLGEVQADPKETGERIWKELFGVH